MNKKVLGILLVSLLMLMAGFVMVLIVNSISNLHAKPEHAVLRCDHEDQAVPLHCDVENQAVPMCTWMMADMNQAVPM